MKLYSTNNKSYQVDLRTAVMQSMPPDKGLYMPKVIAPMHSDKVSSILKLPFAELSFEMASHLLGNAIPSEALEQIIHQAINFPAPVVHLSERISTLELWHGPSLAFKDFGARFMAQLMSYYQQGSDKKLTILVATSGDTGGAVAAGFHNTPGIEVIILYPSGRVSELQEWQLTRLGGNIHACEIKGDFDACQALVKQAFLDDDLNSNYQLSSANSINIARLIPQSFYYAEALKQVNTQKNNLVFCVPSGNLGNLTAGLLAKKIGMPINRFISVTNINKVFPDFLESGTFTPRQSSPTISNAMDVSNPSNYARIADLYNHDIDLIRNDIKGYWYDDTVILTALQKAYQSYNYLCDTHGALGYQAAEEYTAANRDAHVVFLETAHPSKFAQSIEEHLDIKIEIPNQLLALQNKTSEKILLKGTFDSFKEYMLSR